MRKTADTDLSHTFQDVANAVRRLGCQLARQSGVHVLFVDRQGRMVTVVMKNPIKRGTLQTIIDEIGIAKERSMEPLQEPISLTLAVVMRCKSANLSTHGHR